MGALFRIVLTAFGYFGIITVIDHVATAAVSGGASGGVGDSPSPVLESTSWLTTLAQRLKLATWPLLLILLIISLLILFFTSDRKKSRK